MIVTRLTALVVVVVMSLVAVGGPLTAIAQETALADNDALQKNSSPQTLLTNEQNSPENRTDILESNYAMDVIERQLAQLRTVHPEVDVENLTATEIGDLLELYGLDTEGPVCPPCT
jgi:hypothetical protein